MIATTHSKLAHEVSDEKNEGEGGGTGECLGGEGRQSQEVELEGKCGFL